MHSPPETPPAPKPRRHNTAGKQEKFARKTASRKNLRPQPGIRPVAGRHYLPKSSWKKFLYCREGEGGVEDSRAAIYPPPPSDQTPTPLRRGPAGLREGLQPLGETGGLARGCDDGALQPFEIVTQYQHLDLNPPQMMYLGMRYPARLRSRSHAHWAAHTHSLFDPCLQ